MGNAMAAYLFKNMFEVNSCLNSFKHDINCLNTIKTSDLAPQISGFFCLILMT